MAISIPPATRRRLLAIAILAFCAVSIAFPRPWQQHLRHTAHAAAHPALHVLASGRNVLLDLRQRLLSLWSATDEIQRLRHENRALREALARVTDQAHRTDLRLRNYTQIQDFAVARLHRALRLVPATVIAEDTSAWRRSVIINRGVRDGIVEGAAAVWGTSIVGTVVAVRQSAATVRLLTDSRFGLTARLVRTGDVGLLSGTTESDAHLRLRWVHLHPVQEGDLVVSSGIDPLIPPGLTAGQVQHASKAREPLFYDVQVRPLIDLSRLSELLVILPAASDADELLLEQQESPPPP
ncbi:rod shape-determining protein MreC [bacterium]|nr:rod shape-determining protein MreC [bacterium]